MRIKDTLNLGKTKFKMRGNLPVKELEREKEWEKAKVYQKRQQLNKNKPSFILHDGPPYANGDIHMGHAMNKISKDIILRYKSMNGFRAPFVPGWDTHGLPIEQQITKQGHDRKKMKINDFRKLSGEYALKQVQRQKEEFKRLGVAGEWDNPYLTLQHDYEAAEVRVFGKMAEKGLIYKGLKPVIWSWSSESALAEAEVEYHDVTSPSVFFSEKVVDGQGVLDNGTNLIVWTTTPWTIPASEGVTVNPKMQYALIEYQGQKYVVALDLVDKVKELFDWPTARVIKTIPGRKLENIVTVHPFNKNKKIITMLGDFVTDDAGTGLVHTAPGFGEDDYIIGKKYGLDIFAPVDEKGKLTKEAGKDFAGIFYEDANEIALNKLKENHSLIHKMDYTHRYPFDWRTKKPVIFRATPQWFASVKNIKDDILAALDNVSFKPSWGKKRLSNMIKNRNDWVISRQRVWGVPLPIFYAEDGTAIITPATIAHVAKIFEKEGSDAWFNKNAQELLPPNFKSSHSPNNHFTKEMDTMDVWFDSGTSHQGVLAQRDYLNDPADLYLEGSDQYRGWFNSSLITAVAYNGKAPFKQIISQGFTLDGKGHKMSKSLGNTIAPKKIINQMGADIIRLWVSTIDPSADVRVSQDNFVKVADGYKKIRNTIRYLLANTSDFNPQVDQVPFDKLPAVDKYMLLKLNELIKNVKKSYDNFDFLEVHKYLNDFITNDLSAFYLDFAKDIVYIDAKNSLPRRSMQTVMYQCLVVLTKLLTPLIPHTTEEIWSFLKEPEDYAQLAELPKSKNFPKAKEILQQWKEFMDFRKKVLKALEQAREEKIIGKPSEAQLNVYAAPKLQAKLNKLGSNLRELLLVSALNFKSNKSIPTDAIKFNDDLALEVKPAPGEVCVRCRLTKTDVGANPNYPDLCLSCAVIVEQEFPETKQEGLTE